MKKNLVNIGTTLLYVLGIINFFVVLYMLYCGF